MVLRISVRAWFAQNTTAALAGSYSFVNPAVALLVGAGMGHEQLNGWVFAALPLIAAALGMILYGPAVVRVLQGLLPGRRPACEQTP